LRGRPELHHGDGIDRVSVAPLDHHIRQVRQQNPNPELINTRSNTLPCASLWPRARRSHSRNCRCRRPSSRRRGLVVCGRPTGAAMWPVRDATAGGRVSADIHLSDGPRPYNERPWLRHLDCPDVPLRGPPGITRRGSSIYSPERMQRRGDYQLAAGATGDSRRRENDRACSPPGTGVRLECAVVRPAKKAPASRAPAASTSGRSAGSRRTSERHAPMAASITGPSRPRRAPVNRTGNVPTGDRTRM
jgi:hypothetical protein